MRHHKKTSKGTAGYGRRSDPFCDPPKVGDTRVGFFRISYCNSDPMDRFGCAINHIPSSNATFCDAQHTALSGVSVFMFGSMALTLMVPCHEGASDSSSRAQ